MYKKILVLTVVIIALSFFAGYFYFNKYDPESERDNTGSENGSAHETREPDSPSDAGGTNPEQTTQEDPIRAQIDQMTLEEKIGQMVIVGMEGYTLDEDARKMIEDWHAGGFILFGRNVRDAEQLTKLLNSLKKANSQINKIPLFLSVDEEGGRITRMPDELEKLPAPGIIGAVNDEEYSFKIGSMIGEELRLFGFDMNFAPVLDINSNPENPVIGDRSFGSDPDTVARHGIQTMKGIQSRGVIPVVKHFPGHGDTSTDSHLELPRIENTLERLEDFELIPFEQAVGNNADAVMIAHILLPEIDPDNPATLSKTIISGILREKIKFNGVVVTDDMTMGAIANNYGIGEAAVKSVNAGSDIILVCHTQDSKKAVIEALRNAAKLGEIPMERVNESVWRVLQLKQKYGLKDEERPPVSLEELNSKIKDVLKK